MITSKSHSFRGVTLVETVIAAGILALFLGSLFTLNVFCMGLIKMSRETACASQVLQQRIESLRIANWHQVTDATWLRTNLLNADAAGASLLKNLSETLTIVPYGSTTVATIQLTRTAGSTSTISSSSALLAESAVKVIWSVNYNGAPNDRPNSRQTVAVLAKGGVAKW